MDRAKASVLLTRREAAAALAISVDTVARLIERGELRPIRIGRSVRVPRDELERFVNRLKADSDLGGES